MIKVTFEVQTQEEFEFAYQRLMPSLGEVCDGVFGCLVSVVKTSPPAPSPAERGELDKEKVIVNTLRKLEYEDLKKLKEALDVQGVPKVPVVEIDVVRFLKEQREWERQHGWELLKDSITVEDVSLDMMQDDTTPLVDRAIQKSGLCNVLDFLGKKGNI